MPPESDADLLRDYADDRDEAAFGELVRRRIDGIYSTALRRVGGDRQLAEDVTQQVFVALATKARWLATHPDLAGWLHTATRHEAAQLVRSERRRKAREQKVDVMNETHPTRETDWQRIVPVLDAAIDRLSLIDRSAILLRFTERRAFGEIGAALRVSEDAARMRVDRALDKLRAQLARRGIASTSAALGVALADQAIVAAPGELASAVTHAALASGAAGGGALALSILTMSKIKIGIVGALFVASLTTVVVEARANRALTAEFSASQHQSDTFARVQRENRSLSATWQKANGGAPDASELARLQARAARLRARQEGVVDSELRAPQNLGRATPAAAMETFAWAVDRHDLDLLGQYFLFSDDSKAAREAFMARFSEAVRARYGTAERLCAAACFGGPSSDPNVAMQVLRVTEDRRPDQVKLDLWIRSAAGREFAGHDTYVHTADGWSIKPMALADEAIVKLVLSRIDPATGEPLPPKE